MKKEDLLNLLPSIYKRILNNNESITSISKEYEISRNRLAKFLKEEYNYESPSAKFSKLSGNKDYDSIDKKAYERIMNGEKLTSVAKDLGVKRHSLSKRLKQKYNLEILADGKNKINSTFFSRINRRNAYWLGYIYADGCIRKTTLELCSKDYDIIEKFKRDIESEHKIGEKIVNKTIYYRLSIKDFKIINDLISLGAIERKSFIEIDMPKISDEFFCDFLRGFIDGDGTYFLKKHKTLISITIGHANLNFANKLKNKIEKLYDIDFHIYKGKSCYTMALYKKTSINKLINILYKDTDLYLNRKYAKIKNYYCRLETKPQKSQDD